MRIFNTLESVTAGTLHIVLKYQTTKGYSVFVCLFVFYSETSLINKITFLDDLVIFFKGLCHN